MTAHQPSEPVRGKSYSAKSLLKIAVLSLAVIVCAKVTWTGRDRHFESAAAQTAAESTLLHLGYSWAIVSVHDRQVIVMGEAPSEGERVVAYQRVRTAITALESGGAIADFQDQMTVRPAPPSLYEVASSAPSVSEPPTATVTQAIADQVKQIETSALNTAVSTTQKECQAEFSTAMSISQIAFGSDSAKIEASSQPVIAHLADIAKRCTGYKLTVEGHTDYTGRTAHNRDLSQRRAEAVREALVLTGIAKSDIAAIGYGAARPIAKGYTEAAYAQNRRIAFKVSAIGETAKVAEKK